MKTHFKGALCQNEYYTWMKTQFKFMMKKTGSKVHGSNVGFHGADWPHWPHKLCHWGSCFISHFTSGWYFLYSFIKAWGGPAKNLTSVSQKKLQKNVLMAECKTAVSSALAMGKVHGTCLMGQGSLTKAPWFCSHKIMIILPVLRDHIIQWLFHTGFTLQQFCIKPSVWQS